MWALLLAVSLWRGADAFSNYAGACEHAGVQHGLDYFEPQARPLPGPSHEPAARFLATKP